LSKGKALDNVMVANPDWVYSVQMMKQLTSKIDKKLRKLALLPRTLMGPDLLQENFDTEIYEPKIIHYFAEKQILKRHILQQAK
jgi:hypothetical protein